ncbi:MAG: alpha/beta fold hydrolase [Nocardioidaceae bacterium]
MTNSQESPAVRYLQRPEGRVAYDVRGEGPLVVCVAGMGDIRATYRYLAPALAEAGHRVAVLELRGHGDSDTTFSAYDDPAAASDIVALVEELGGPALLVGHSMGAAASVIAAADRPELVTGLVLIGAFVREPKLNPLLGLAMRAAMQPPWAKAVWKRYLPSLYAGRRPADFEAHRDAVMAALARPGHTRAFCRTTATNHRPAQPAAARVHAPTLVVMGELDPDFKDPKAEAEWIRTTLGGEVLMVPESGHYPYAQRPDLVNPAVAAFAAKVSAGA